MITGISIENFKGIRERVTLDLRPITLLFGANSAGKSTILHALHYAREVFERHNLNADQTIAGGKYIDLGGFQRMLHGGDHGPNSEGNRGIILEFDVAAGEKDLADANLNYSMITSILNEDGDFPRLDLESEVSGDRWLSGVTSIQIRLGILYSIVERQPYVSDLAISFNGERFAELTASSNLRGVAISRLNLAHPHLRSVGQFYQDRSDVEQHELNGEGGIANGDVNQQSLLQRLAEYCDTFLRYESTGPLQVINLHDALPSSEQTLRLLSPEFTVLPVAGAKRSFMLSGTAGDREVDIADITRMISGHDLSGQLELILSRLIVGPCRLLCDCLKDFRYLGPLRETPARVYYPPKFPDPSRWSSGLGAWDSLQNGPDELVDAVGQWLGDESHLNAGCTLERRSYLELDAADPIVRKLLNRQAFDDVEEGEGLDLSKVPMKSRIVIVSGNSDAELRPHDVGIGISQVVPVIVTALDGEERLLAIEQPELHIHPRLQAAIADLFIESIHKNKHRFIIETHSEHLILRLLRRIRETEKRTAPLDRELRTDELGIYYLKQENGSTTASRIDVDVKGEFIQPWPDDFFEIDFFERFPDAR